MSRRLIRNQWGHLVDAATERLIDEQTGKPLADIVLHNELQRQKAANPHWLGHTPGLSHQRWLEKKAYYAEWRKRKKALAK